MQKTVPMKNGAIEQLMYFSLSNCYSNCSPAASASSLKHIRYAEFKALL